jgi:hypothetical protein
VSVRRDLERESALICTFVAVPSRNSLQSRVIGKPEDVGVQRISPLADDDALA